MDPADSDRDGQEGINAPVRRACDQCRVRKIRCDKRSPCSNCRSSNTVCRSTGEGQRPQEPRRRVLISSQYEKKIDLIEERLGGVEETLTRLGGIEDALRDLASTSRQHVSSPTRALTTSHPSPRSQVLPRFSVSKQTHKGRKGPGYTSNAAIEQHDSNSGFEGSSSLAAHSAYAREFLESAVSHSTPEVLSSPKISEALSSLRQIVEMQNQRHGTTSLRGQISSQSNRVGVRCDIRDLEMPPLPTVLDILRSLKENPTSTFGGYIPFLTVDYFIEKCREVYFSTDEYSEASFIVANFGLYTIFVELAMTGKDATSRVNYHHYMQLSKDNLEAAMASLNILMPATLETVMALSLGAMHGIEICKPSVSWSLASMALQMSQTLGFHRASSMERDPPSVREQKQVLFWSIYTVINLMSLRLGRASGIQDYEIDIPPPREVFSKTGSWATICVIWANQAMIQSQVYTHLYSPAALNKPESERVSHARRLASEMVSNIIEPFERIAATGTDFSDLDMIYLQTDKVSRLALLTLIYRAIPEPAKPGSSGAFIPECIETARAALEHHQACASSLKETSEALRCSYMHWALFFSPFVPFIVIFCHVIATSNSQDLTRLEDFIASLQPLCAFSQSIDRLHGLCSVLGTVARLYVEEKPRSQIGEDKSIASVGQEFDAYLGALGLAPGNMPSSQGYFQPDVSSTQTGMPDASQQMPGMSVPISQPQGQQDTVPLVELSQAEQLGNWYSGNQYMMGLLEEDLFQFNPNAQ